MNMDVPMKREDVGAWIQSVMPHHIRLTEVLVPLIKGLIDQNHIEYLSISGRTKDIKSVLEKTKRKNYKSPDTQMTDITGIRIITYFDSHVHSIGSLISGSFGVDAGNSLDRATVLGNDKLGYRSVHFVCTLGEKRAELPEFANLGELKFEIQVRTVLQHAWAELAHDRAYKFPGVLPQDLQRKLNLYSGMLEIVDAAFDEIAVKIDQYSHSIMQGDPEKTREVPIDSINVIKFVDKYADAEGVNVEGDVGAGLIGELKAFGIKNIGDFDDLVRENNKLIFSGDDDYTYYSSIRDAMMLRDIDRYFSSAWNDGWGTCDRNTIVRLNKKHGDKKVASVLDKYSILIENEPGGED